MGHRTRCPRCGKYTGHLIGYMDEWICQACLDKALKAAGRIGRRLRDLVAGKGRG